MSPTKWLTALATGTALLLPCLIMAQTVASVPQLEYTVQVDDLGSQRLHIQLQFSNVVGDSLLLHGVPVYMDNPTVAAVDAAVRNLQAFDETGHALSIRPAGSPDGHPTWWITGVSQGRITYDLVVDFQNSKVTERYGILIPYMNPTQAWLYGNTLFCFLQLGPDVRQTSTQAADIRLRFLLPDSIPLVALADTTSLHSIYELMSLQFGLGRFLIESDSVGDIAFDTVYRDEKEYNSKERRLLLARTREMIETEVRYFGGAPFQRFAVFYFRRPGTGGLEGSNACQVYAAPDVDVTDSSDLRTRTFYSVAVHEIFHTWNPVYVPAIDDPWIKEGVSSYAHLVLSGRLGYLTTEDIASSWKKYFQQLEDNPKMREIALTDPQLWTKEYEGEEWRLITYERGMVTALLLDVFLRDATDNRKSLDNVLAALHATYTHRGYSHEDLMKTIHHTTGVDVSDFFAEYIDGTQAPSRTDVTQAYQRAVTLGVFAN